MDAEYAESEMIAEAMMDRRKSKMNERQKEFLRALIDCGISMNTLVVVGTLIKTETSMNMMTRMILEAENRGEKITDGLVGQILVDIMKMATENSSSNVQTP